MIKIMCNSFFKLLQLTTIMIDYHAMNMRRERQKMKSQFPLQYRCSQTATCLILSNHFFPLGYPFEKIVIRSNGYPFEKEFVDRSSD